MKATNSDAEMRRNMRAYLDTLTIHGDNIGDIRRSLFMPFDSQWNGWVREDTAEREVSPPAPPIYTQDGVTTCSPDAPGAWIPKFVAPPREPDVVPFRDYYEAYVLRSTWPNGKSFATFAREIWDYLQASAASAPAAAHTRAEWTTLILAHLTPQDFERFHAAHITYSGSTGPVARLEHYPTTGAYIATFAVNLVAALTALEWTHPDVRLEGQSLIVTRASIAPTWFCQQCSETFTNTRLAAAHSRDTYHVITSDPNRPSTPGGLADARSKDA